MNISIPLFSLPLLVAAFLIVLGLMVAPLSARLGVIGIGSGAALMTGVVFSGLPRGYEIQAIVLFGITMVVGIWMVLVGLTEHSRS